MRTIILICFLSMSLAADACSGIFKSFCYVKSQRPDHFVISGVISGTLQNAIQLNVIDVFSGVETRSVITIWDGSDYDCNGNVSMKASDMGVIGDTLIALLPMITNIQNNWDITGDYRRPVSLYETAWLNVKKDSVRGYIAGMVNTPMVKYPYAAFKTYWNSHGSECLTLSVENAEKEKMKVMVSDRRITVISPSEMKLTVRLHSPDGKLIVALPAEKYHELDCSYLAPGVYLLSVRDGGGSAVIRKIIL